MNRSLLFAIGMVAVGGLLQGSFAAPMKRVAGWRWENVWLLFALFGLLVFPWIFTFVTVPHVSRVYAEASITTEVKVVGFGLLWGVGSTLFGLGISRVGMGLGFALILGITASFGSLLPLAILHPEQLVTKRGIALILGTVIMLLGLALLALAGRARDHALKTSNGVNSGFTLGFVICIFSGVFSSMLNFSFVFGDELRLRALEAGAGKAMAANTVWALAVTGGFLSNCVYCVYLLNKNRAWSAFGKGNPFINWLLAGSMGWLWFGGIVIYGIGAASLGSLGSIVGWPIFMAVIIIAALFWGACFGEWKDAPRKALVYNWAGVGVLLLAIGVISAGNTG